MKTHLKYIGPGIVVAATGIGAGDMIAAAVGGSSYGYTILWAVVIGAIFKYVLNEGIGRWQLSTGMSIPEAWIKLLPAFFQWYFIIYLLLWSVIVAAALIAASGLAAHSLLPVLTVNEWGIVHTIIALFIVLFGNYNYFEKIMKVIIGMMFTVVIISVIIVTPDLNGIIEGTFIPQISKGSAPYIMAVMGGVGGSVTLLSYGYWIAEKKWKGKEYISQIRIDLSVAYILTGLFGISVVVLATNLEPEVVKSNKIILAMADQMEVATGTIGSWIFLIGFWGAVFSSMLGVWQGVPYLFADYLTTWRKETNNNAGLNKTNYYKAFLIFLALPPIAVLYYGKPVWLIMVYSVIGSLFMPFLAVSLIWLNNKKKWIGEKKNSLFINILLAFTLCLFIYLFVVEILRYYSG